MGKIILRTAHIDGVRAEKSLGISDHKVVCEIQDNTLKNTKYYRKSAYNSDKVLGRCL